jgi:voltage-gated potassium channel Kch
MSTPTSHEINVEPKMTLRRFVYAWLFDQNNPNNYQKKFDSWIVWLIIANVLSIVVEHIPILFEPNKQFFSWFEQISLGIFTVEYLLRLYAAPEDPDYSGSRLPRLKFIRSPYALIDAAAILPFYLALFTQLDLRVLRALRILRLLKLFRVVMPAFQEFRRANAGRTFRQQVYALLNPTETSGKLHELLDTVIVWWVFISVMSVILESVAGLHYLFNLHFIVIDAFAVFIFSMEYIFRLYSIPEDPKFQGAIAGRFSYARSPIVVIDLLAIIPFFLESLLGHLFDLRFLRVFRLMRLLKLTRYTTSTGTLMKALKREWPVIGASTFIMLLLVILTASLGYLFEHEAQPDKFENIPQAIYWAVVTLASVGYGDISPITPVGRLMTIIMALVGIGIFAVPAAILSTAFNDQLHKDREAMHAELMRYMHDGVIDDDEYQQLLKEAEQLHITKAEVDILIEQAKRDQKEAGMHLLPIAAIKEMPEVAFEQFRMAISNLRQIAAAGDTEKLKKLFETPGRATDDERAIWRQINTTGTN